MILVLVMIGDSLCAINVQLVNFNKVMICCRLLTAGLDHVKECVTEMAIWPLLRPDIFKGCRSPGRGLLLFGPPVSGTKLYH